MHSHSVQDSGSADATAASAGPMPVPSEPFSHVQLFTLTSALIGIQFCWAVQVGYVTKSLLTLGIPQRFVSYAWLAGPIAGIIVQPIAGILSDRCTSRFGRRRPFLAGGSAMTVLCLILFSFARPLGLLLGDPVITSNEIVVAPRALSIAVTSFWALDFSINAAQGPLRALLADVVPPSQHNAGNSFFALATGIGNFLGSFLGAVPLTKYLPFFYNDLQALYSIAAFTLVLCVSVTLISTHETPLPKSTRPIRNNLVSAVARQEERDGSPRRRLVNESTTSSPTNASTPVLTPAPVSRFTFFEAARTAPAPFWPAFTVQCFSWFAWFTLFVFGTSWVGSEVLRGSFTAAPGTPARDSYDAGVRLGNLGIALQSVLTIFISPLLPRLIRHTSSRAVYLCASLLLGMALSGALIINQPWESGLAVAMIASTGFSWSVTMTIPWSLMSEAVARDTPERAGIYTTMFNLSQCFPEVLVSLVAERVIKVTGSQAAVLGLGGLAAFGAAASIVGLGVGNSNSSVDGVSGGTESRNMEV